MKQISPLHNEIIEEVKAFHKSESKILDLLQKIDSARLYLETGYSSLFQYSVQFLKLSESQSWTFMTVARKSKEIPELKNQIDAGELSVSTARRIVPVLEKSNQAEWIEKAKTLTKSELEKEVSKISPHAFKRKEIVRSLSENESSVRFQISDEKLKKWKRMQTLMMSKKRKTLDLMSAIDELVEDFLSKEDPLLQKDKVTKSIPGSGQVHVAKRHIPTHLRRQVLKRDQGRCQFKSPLGKLCGNENFIQIHHLEPWAYGGRHSLDNLQTLCASHHSFGHRHFSAKAISEELIAELSKR